MNIHTYIHTYTHTPIRACHLGLTSFCNSQQSIHVHTTNTRTIQLGAHHTNDHIQPATDNIYNIHTHDQLQHLQCTYTRSTMTFAIYIHTINDNIYNIHTHNQLQHTYKRSMMTSTTYIHTINRHAAV